MTTKLEDVRRPHAYEPCEECGAPMDPQQRYCVNCAARRGNGANPSSRYFAMMSKRARRPQAAKQNQNSQTGRAAAVGFFALLPIAVALGVMVGRSGGGDNSDALLRALRERQATASSAAPTAAAAESSTKAKKKATPKTKKAEAAAEKKSVVAETENGTVHAVTSFHASEEKKAEDTKLVEENPEQTGENYIKAQQNLPDVTVVGGDGSTAAAPAGAEP